GACDEVRVLGYVAMLLVRVVGVEVIVVAHVLDQHGEHVFRSGPEVPGREVEPVRRITRAAKENAVEPGAVDAGSAGYRGERDPGLGAGSGEPAAVPDVAMVEAVLVGVEHRRRGRLGRVVGGAVIGKRPAAVV